VSALGRVGVARLKHVAARVAGRVVLPRNPTHMRGNVFQACNARTPTRPNAPTPIRFPYYRWRIDNQMIKNTIGINAGALTPRN
jgi:hypothetical protein